MCKRRPSVASSLLIIENNRNAYSQVSKKLINGNIVFPFMMSDADINVPVRAFRYSLDCQGAKLTLNFIYLRVLYVHASGICII